MRISCLVCTTFFAHLITLDKVVIGKVPVSAAKVYEWSRGITPLIFNLGARWWCLDMVTVIINLYGESYKL